MQPKIAAIGVLTVVAFVLCAVAVFTPVWMVSTGWQGKTGIIPFHSHEKWWYAVGSWFMFISFGLYFPMAWFALFAWVKAAKQGLCRENRLYFIGIALIAFLITGLTALAFIFFASNTGTDKDYADALPQGHTHVSLGYSAYLALISAIFTGNICALAGYVAIRDCNSQEN